MIDERRSSIVACEPLVERFCLHGTPYGPDKVGGMIIVQGVFRIAPEERATFLAQSDETMRLSRAEAGCIEYVLAADPLEDDRVVLSERWATRENFDGHVAALTTRRRAAAEAGTTPVAPMSREISYFEASEVDLGR